MSNPLQLFRDHAHFHNFMAGNLKHVLTALMMMLLLSCAAVSTLFFVPCFTFDVHIDVDIDKVLVGEIVPVHHDHALVARVGHE